MSAASNHERVGFRASKDTKALIERAAFLSGTTISNYLRQVAVSHSEDLIASSESRVLSDRDRDRFLEALDNPPAPNEALASAARDYAESIRRGELIHP